MSPLLLTPLEITSRSHPSLATITLTQRGLGELIVKRFLLLVLLLDRVASRAAEARAPTPVLFRVGSTIKSSSEVRH